MLKKHAIYFRMFCCISSRMQYIDQYVVKNIFSLFPIIYFHITVVFLIRKVLHKKRITFEKCFWKICSQRNINEKQETPYSAYTLHTSFHTKQCRCLLMCFTAYCRLFFSFSWIILLMSESHNSGKHVLKVKCVSNIKV